MRERGVFISEEMSWEYGDAKHLNGIFTLLLTSILFMTVSTGRNGHNHHWEVGSNCIVEVGLDWASWGFGRTLGGSPGPHPSSRCWHVGPILWYTIFWLKMIAHFICCSSKLCGFIGAKYICILHAHSLPTFVVDYLHTNIHQHSWKWLEINPTTMLDALLLWFYTDIDGVNLVFNSCQHLGSYSVFSLQNFETFFTLGASWYLMLEFMVLALTDCHMYFEQYLSRMGTSHMYFELDGN